MSSASKCSSQIEQRITLLTAPILTRRAGDVIATLCRSRDDGGHHEGDRKRNESRQRLQGVLRARPTCRDAGDGCRQHRADSDGIDIVEMGALEFYPGRA